MVLVIICLCLSLYLSLSFSHCILQPFLSSILRNYPFPLSPGNDIIPVDCNQTIASPNRKPNDLNFLNVLFKMITHSFM